MERSIGEKIVDDLSEFNGRLEMLAEIEQLRKQLVEAKADAARLDWMDTHQFTAYHDVDIDAGYVLDDHCVVVDGKNGRDK